MRGSLTLHPDFNSPPTAITAETGRASGRRLTFRFVVSGRIAAVRLPAPAAPARTDGLWRTTCLEAFVGAAGRETYVELNLSPSTQWAAYRFDGYRRGMAAAPVVGVPAITLRTTADRLELDAEIALDADADLPGDAPWRLGLSAVIEAADGSLSYWALAHPPGRPDFHHPDCFAAELAATDAP